MGQFGYLKLYLSKMYSFDILILTYLKSTVCLLQSVFCTIQKGKVCISETVPI